MRRWVASGGTFLILFALALPAHAGLGDLFDEVLDDPIADLTAPLAPLVTSVPLAEDLVETVDVVTSPLVTVVDEVASPVVTVVDEVVVEPVMEVVDPVTDTVDPVIDTVDPVVDTVDPVIDTAKPLPTLDVYPTLTTAASVAKSSPATPAPVGVAPVVQATVVFGGPVETASVQRVLLTSISNATIPLDDREGNHGPVSKTSWLTALGAWLESGLSGLLDVIALPVRFLELLFRALISAGSGLVAPAAILTALAVAGRRRLLPAS